MGWLGRLFGEKSDEALPLYTGVVARARQPHWYLDGQVPDTIDGRFDMIACILGFVVLRLEEEEAGAALSAVLTERFVDDMDGQLREQGVGDVVVGKHIGKMMGMLGGRLGAYRDGLAGEGIDAALVRNLYRGDRPAPAALAHVRNGLLAFRAALAATPIATVAEGKIP
ncbi:ubiquinol-cytochrome C chaperone family protein [Sphingomonas sp. PB4P5]|uniref:ubiquinol-cytochrome C chaperone family protein n=1 Tax=Parasphingomonas puruogangriensis TaxID=3096155 RepID=UPI002FC7B648